MHSKQSCMLSCFRFVAAGILSVHVHGIRIKSKGTITRIHLYQSVCFIFVASSIAIFWNHFRVCNIKLVQWDSLHTPHLMVTVRCPTSLILVKLASCTLPRLDSLASYRLERQQELYLCVCVIQEEKPQALPCRTYRAWDGSPCATACGCSDSPCSRTRYES